VGQLVVSEGGRIGGSAFFGLGKLLVVCWCIPSLVEFVIGKKCRGMVALEN